MDIETSEETRVGDWIQTYTGLAAYPMDLRLEEICIEDIAHALAYQCRFSGHVKEHYSVAEHSVRVSLIVPSEDALWGLLHDASEAYLVDLPRPIKRWPAIGEPYKQVETAIMKKICQRFGLAPEQPASVHYADTVLLMTEKRDIMGPPPKSWKEDGVEPLAEKIVPWWPAKAKASFLDRFYELKGKR